MRKSFLTDKTGIAKKKGWPQTSYEWALHLKMKARKESARFGRVADGPQRYNLLKSAAVGLVVCEPHHHVPSPKNHQILPSRLATN